MLSQDELEIRHLQQQLNLKKNELDIKKLDEKLQKMKDGQKALMEALADTEALLK